MYTLTDTTSVACHGTSYQTFGKALEYALWLRTLGLCATYKIGRYYGGKHIWVYDSEVGILPDETERNASWRQFGL